MDAPAPVVVAPVAPVVVPSAAPAPASIAPAIAKKRAFAAPAATAAAPAPRKAVVAAAAAATAATPAPAPSKSRAKSAWQFFCDAKRAGIVAAHPGAGMGEVSKLMGAAWAAEADKAPYEALAAAAKAAAPPAPAAGKKKGAGTAAPTAYALFCRDLRPTLASANPGADMGTMSKLLAGAWAGADAGVKAQYEASAAADKAAAMAATAEAAAAAGGGAAVAAPAAVGATKRKARCAGGWAERPSAADEAFDADAAARAGGRPSPAERALAEEEADRTAVDWASHPAEAILAETERGHYVVKRAGLGLHEYGLVDAAAAKRARLEGADALSDPPPSAAAAPAAILPPALIEAYEASVAAFDTALHARCEGNALDLDDLEAATPLEACAFLGGLREVGYPLAARAAGVRARTDRQITVPMLGLSRLVQRAVEVERAGREAAEGECARLRAKLAAAGGGEAGVGAAGVGGEE